MSIRLEFVVGLIFSYLVQIMGRAKSRKPDKTIVAQHFDHVSMADVPPACGVIEGNLVKCGIVADPG